MIVVFDTNIWEGNAYLQSPAGAAVRFYLRQQNASIGVPEVIRLEIEQHLELHIENAVAALEENYRLLLRLFGRMKELVLPTANEVKDKVGSMINSIGVQIIDVPFSLDSARSSFIKIVNKQPPSSKNNQQFKDGVIWADCLRLAEQDDVVLITDDRGFYQDREISKGMAKNLALECSTLPFKIEILSDINSLIRMSRVANVGISMNYILDNLLNSDDTAIKMANANGFDVGDVIVNKHNLFATEKPNILYVSFEVLLACRDVTEAGRIDAKLKIGGETDYNTDSKNFGNIKRTGDVLMYALSDGTSEERKSHYGSAFMSMGHREIVDTVRFLLQTGDESGHV